MKMDMSSDMEKLKAAEGQAFDRMFLDMMIPHHQMAIDMSKEASRKAEHAEIKTFARNALAKQQREIIEMNRFKVAVGGTTARKPAPKANKPTGSGHSGHSGH